MDRRANILRRYRANGLLILDRGERRGHRPAPTLAGVGGADAKSEHRDGGAEHDFHGLSPQIVRACFCLSLTEGQWGADWGHAPKCFTARRPAAAAGSRSCPAGDEFDASGLYGSMDGGWTVLRVNGEGPGVRLRKQIA
jgi:hypothetical protein